MGAAGEDTDQSGDVMAYNFAKQLKIIKDLPLRVNLQGLEDAAKSVQAKLASLHRGTGRT